MEQLPECGNLAGPFASFLAPEFFGDRFKPSETRQRRTLNSMDEKRPMKILHLEDNAEDAELVREMLTAQWPSCDVTCVSNRAAFTRELQTPGYEVILSDFRLQQMNGMDALQLAKEHAPDIPFIFVSGTRWARIGRSTRCGPARRITS